MNQKQEFAARVARINAGGLHTRHTLFVGMEETFVLHGDLPRPKRRSDIEAEEGDALSMLIAFTFGIVALVLARYLMFQVLGVTQSPATATDMVIEGVLALALAYIVCLPLNASRGVHVIAQATGVALATVALHNLVHLAPDPFVYAFSPDWVAGVLRETAPASLRFGAQTLTF